MDIKMDDDSLKQLWMASGKGQDVDVDTRRLVDSISARLSSIERLAKRRNRSEIFIAIIMLPLFAWWLIAVPLFWVRIGSGIILLSCLLIIYRFSTYKRKIKEADSASDLKMYLTVSLSRIQSEIMLLKTVFWWYLLPCFAGVICFFYAYPYSIFYKLLYTGIVAAVYYYVYRLNRNVIKRKLEPLKENLLSAINRLE
jgi:hypothetical protein